MALYRYVKEEPVYDAPRRFPEIFSYALMTFGLGILVWTVWPIVSFSLFTEGTFAGTLSPMFEDAGRDVSVVAEAAERVPEDLTQMHAWYPDKPQEKGSMPVKEYRLTIPKLKITDAKVMVAGDDLNASLIHYGGTPLPGKYGNTVIFGHSTLPQFFDPNNYKSIFSTLPTMKVGEDFTLFSEGISYTYTITDMIVLDPNDLSVLEQKFDDSYVTLVTCVPPGTYWKRLNVHAKLRKI